MLCKYISHRIPESEAGGRSGKKIYEELEQHAVDVRLQLIPERWLT